MNNSFFLQVISFCGTQRGMSRHLIPALEWIRNYQSKDFRGDLSAGGVVAIMLVPQGMAYAMLAGLPPVAGLYASTLPLIVYALFGSSRHLAVGPVAMMSLLVYAGVSPLADPGSEKYIGLVLLLSMMVGLMQVGLGFLRAGFFVNFLSHAVISGFTSAAAIVILLSQLPHLLGIKVSGGHSAFHLLEGIGRSIGNSHPITFGIGLTSLVTLEVFKKKRPHFPAPILVVAGSIFLVYLFGLDQYGVKIVGQVPKRLATLSFPVFDIESIQALFQAALTILFVGFMESISVAQLIAAKEKYKVDSNQELIGLGLANLTASFFSAYPVTGGFSRTAVNHQAGARTGLSSIVTATIILLTLTFFISFFYYLPNTVLAAVVIVAVVGLIDVKGVRHLFSLKRMDGWTMTLTFLATLVLGSEKGILLGAAFSLLLFIWRSSRPHAAELGYLEKENVFRNIKRYPEVQTYPEILILRIDESLYFANMAFLEDFLHHRIAEKPYAKWVIMDLSGVNDMDAVAVDTLEDLMASYHERGIQFLFAGMKGPVRDLVVRAGWEKKHGEQIGFLSIQHALQKIRIL